MSQTQIDNFYFPLPKHMTREIKFRAYDAICNNTFPVSRMVFSERTLKFFEWWVFDDLQRSSTFQEYLLQYTWFKDSKDTEIYEGDIVEVEYQEDYKLDSDWKLENTRLDVIFSEWWQRVLRDFWPRSKWWKIWMDLDRGGYVKMKVIWNIYQTPELLPLRK